MLDYPLTDVLDLVREHLDHAQNTKQQADAPRPQPRNSGKEKVIYRQAGDEWF